MRMRQAIRLAFLVLLLFLELANPVMVMAAGQCGPDGDTYNGNITGCYAINVGGKVVPRDPANPSYWDCGPARQCFYFEKRVGTCGTDVFIDNSNKRRITFCSASSSLGNRTPAPGYTGCGFGSGCFVGGEIGNGTCNFNTNQDNTISFCFSGFPSADELQGGQAQFYCDHDCGGLIESGFSSTQPQVQSLRTAPIGSAENGLFSCVNALGGFDQSVKNAINYKVSQANVGCTVAEVGAFAGAVAVTGGAAGAILGDTVAAAGLAGSVTSVADAAYVAGQVGINVAKGAAILTIDATVTGGTGDVCKNLFTNYHPTIVGRVLNSKGETVCAKEIQVQVNATGDTQIVNPDLKNQSVYQLCSQIPGDQKQQKSQCCSCAGFSTDPTTGQCGSSTGAAAGLWTAVGCIPTSQNGLVAALIKIGLGISGGVALLMILVSAFMFSTSEGDQKRITDAQEMLTSAVIGLVFIIFSVTLLQFIGVSILHLPGFGS